MERLTTRCAGHAVMAWEHEEQHTTQEWIDMLTDRLAAYEDTGLTPEEVADLLAIHRGMEGNEYVVLDDELRSILFAKNKGRLVVLPCNDNAELMRDGETYKADHWNHALTAFRDDPTTRSGKRVALFSIKEAEAALKGEG